MLTHFVAQITLPTASSGDLPRLFARQSSAPDSNGRTIQSRRRCSKRTVGATRGNVEATGSAIAGCGRDYSADSIEVERGRAARVHHAQLAEEEQRRTESYVQNEPTLQLALDEEDRCKMLRKKRKSSGHVSE